MENSKVYFTDMHTTDKENLQQKLARLLKTAGIGEIDFEKKFTAIKIHFGEPGNLAYLRPNYAKTVVDTVKEMGGKPFLTDCSTLYPGYRKNALEHLDTAYLNGFTPFSTGCHVLMGDGLKGTDEILVPVPSGKYITEAKVGHVIMDADVLISLTHFKGHMATGIGGVIKNIGMGCGSRGGKMAMHSSGKPVLKEKRCTGCGTCIKNCAHNAITLNGKKASIDITKCVGCGRCIAVCPFNAVLSPFDEANDILNQKIVEYTWAVLNGRPHFHISMAMDISPDCDCFGSNDIPIVPDVGMFASFDPVALDIACAEAVNAQPPLTGSILAKNDGGHHDHFAVIHPGTHWQTTIEHAVKMGVGSDQFDLITI